jgi:hypothetical protein
MNICLQMANRSYIWSLAYSFDDSSKNIAYCRYFLQFYQTMYNVTRTFLGNFGTLRISKSATQIVTLSFFIAWHSVHGSHKVAPQNIELCKAILVDAATICKMETPWRVDVWLRVVAVGGVERGEEDKVWSMWLDKWIRWECGAVNLVCHVTGSVKTLQGYSACDIWRFSSSRYWKQKSRARWSGLD